MNARKLVSTLGIGLALSFATGAAQSALLTFEDDDLDFLLRGDDFTNPITSDTNFQVGDTLLSVFEIPNFTTDGVNSIPAGQELTGVAGVTITDISDPTFPVGTTITFGAADLDGILAANGVNLAMPLGAGAAVAMFFNGAPGGAGDTDLEIAITDGNPAGNPSCTSLADCLEQATLGSKFQVDGFLGDPDESWTSVITQAGGANPSVVLGVNNAQIVANFNAALSNIFHASGEVGFIDIASGAACAGPGGVGNADGCAQLTLSGTVTGGGGIPADHGAFAHSDFDANKITAAVPEPATLLLLSAGLLGIGASRGVQKHIKNHKV
ncbi:MAG: PEP-CTERM sorting domain-containing protein [Nitrococcus mobilis]|nr:PEP-CTERM sorting domain-containing protein [Nitrococcus mobilis]